MNTTDPENMPGTPSQPARITRRSFVKRTSATVIVTVLALHAFRHEARAEESGDYYYWPVMVLAATAPKSIIVAHEVERMTVNGAAWNRVHRVLMEYTHTPTLPDELLDASKTLTLSITFTHDVYDNADLGWQQAGQVTTSSTVTVTNPNYPSYGDEEITGSCTSEVSNGCMYVANQTTVKVGTSVIQIIVMLNGAIIESGVGASESAGYYQIFATEDNPDELVINVPGGDLIKGFEFIAAGELEEFGVPAS
jgi:hypothetical protein